MGSVYGQSTTSTSSQKKAPDAVTTQSDLETTRSLAEQGDAQAQYILADAYYKGLGIEKIMQKPSYGFKSQPIKAIRVHKQRLVTCIAKALVFALIMRKPSNGR